MYQQQPQLQGVADLLANQGRYGDSMLVHMNPVEVQGLASMSPTGSLTINPETGQPEAFLPFLAPLLSMGIGSVAGGALAGGLGLGTLGTLAAKAAVTEGISALTQGRDFNPLKALASGVTQFGLGAASDTLLSGADKAVDAADLARQQATEALATGAAPEVIGPTALASENLTSQAIGDLANQAAQDVVSDMTLGQKFGEIVSRPGDAFKAISSPEALIPIGIGESTNLQIDENEMWEDWQKDEKRRKGAEYEDAVARKEANVYDPNITPDPYATSPAYGSSYSQLLNAGGIVSLDPNDFRRRFNELQALDRPVVGMFYGGGVPPIYGNVGMGPNNPIPAGRQAALRDPFVISPEQLQQTYQTQGLPGFGPEIMYFTPKKGEDPNPFKDWVPDPLPEEGTEGGTENGDTTTPKFDLALLNRFTSGEITWEEYRELAGLNATTSAPETTKKSATTTEAVVPQGITLPKDWTPQDYTQIGADLYNNYMNYGGGFNLGNIGMNEGGGVRGSIVEWLANQRRLREKDEKRKREVDPFTFEQWKGRASGEIEDLLELIMGEEKGDEEKAKWRGLPSASGTHPMQIFHSGAAEKMLRGDDFVESMQEGGETQAQTEADRLISLTQMAVLGRLPEEEADVVIQAFIDEFGEEAFQALRESTLEGVVPGSQKEGEIVGVGGGMDDMIPGMIGDQQPVAVSPGEYIVPADVVSGIGDGSTDSGVQELDGMLDRVRMERTGTTQQPQPLRKGGVLPR
jgi:hypothetical protein